MQVSLSSREERFVRVFWLNISAATETYLKPYFFPRFLNQNATVCWLFNFKCLKYTLNFCLRQGPRLLVLPGKVHKHTENAFEEGWKVLSVNKAFVFAFDSHIKYFWFTSLVLDLLLYRC